MYAELRFMGSNRVSEIRVNEKIGLGFGQGLRSIGLRQTSGLACLGLGLGLGLKCTLNRNEMDCYTV